MTQEVRTWTARLDDTHDGDTIRLIINLRGFDALSRKWLRLRDVFAPELDQIGGASSRTFTARTLDSLVSTSGGASWPLEVDTYRTSGDNDVKTLDRYVAEVRSLSGVSLNEAVNAYLAAHPDWGGGTGGSGVHVTSCPVCTMTGKRT